MMMMMMMMTKMMMMTRKRKGDNDWKVYGEGRGQRRADVNGERW